MKIANPVARIGEDLACKFLKSKGYNIIERNFRKGYGEIDIVALNEGNLVFVEVKTRMTDNFGTPFEAITPWKLKSLVKTAQFYKSFHQNLPQSLRIDAVSVKIDKNNVLKEIELLKNVSGF